MHVHPGTLVAYVRELEQVLVEPRFLARGPEQRLVRAGRTRRDNDPVEVMLLDGLLDGADPVLRARVQVPGREDHVREGRGVFGHVLDVEEACNVAAAMADKDSDTWLPVAGLRRLSCFFLCAPGDVRSLLRGRHIRGRLATGRLLVSQGHSFRCYSTSSALPSSSLPASSWPQPSSWLPASSWRRPSSSRAPSSSLPASSWPQPSSSPAPSSWRLASSS